MRNNVTDIRIAFFGTPYFSVYVLEELVKMGMPPALVVTVPERPAGRGLLPRASPVKMWAEKNNLPVIVPEKLEQEDKDSALLYAHEWDAFIVAGYGKMLPTNVLTLAKKGTFNVHPSLLPKYRGPSPIETQIREDESNIGVSIILLDEETDHGPILAQTRIERKKEPFTRSELENILWHEGGKLLARSLPAYIEGTLKPTPQNHTEATFTKKLEKEFGLIDLSADGYTNYLKFCAYEGWPGTFFFTKRNGKDLRIKVTNAEFAGGEFRILQIIPEGGREIAYADFLRSL